MGAQQPPEVFYMEVAEITPREGGAPLQSRTWSGRWAAFCERLINHKKPTPDPALADSGSPDKAKREASRAIKRHLPAWSPVRLIAGARESTNKTVESISMLVLDFEPDKEKPDSKVSIRAVKEAWNDWNHLFFTTTGHQKNDPRCRLVIPFNRGVTPSEYKQIWNWAARRCDAAGLSYDPSAKDVRRLWLFPYVNHAPWVTDSQADVWDAKGGWLKVEDVLSNQLQGEAAGVPLAYEEGAAGLLFFTDVRGFDPLSWAKKKLPGQRIKGFCPKVPEAERNSMSAWMTKYKAGVLIGCTSAKHGHEVPLKIWISDPNAIGTAKMVMAKLPALDWKLDKQGNPVSVQPTRHNLRVILREDPRFFKRLAYDPWLHYPVIDGELATDVTIDTLQGLVERTYFGVDVAPDKFRRAVDAVAGETIWNPLKDHLLSLKWDGVPRIETWLTKTFQVADTPINRKIQSRWLIQAAARALDPGCKADTVLVLKGEQGYFKSTALKIIASDKYFSDSKLRIDHRSVYTQLAGAWIHELAEFASIRKADVEDVKAFLATSEDLYTPVYGKLPVRALRKCVFCATTNNEEFLRDPTGARRFLPIEIDKPGDLDWLREHRNLLVAEAVAAWKAGVIFHFTPDDVKELSVAQFHFQETDPWDVTLQQWRSGAHKFKVVTATWLLEHVFAISRDRQDARHSTKIGSLLIKQGWRRHVARINGVQSKFYVAPGVSDAEAKTELRKLWGEERASVMGGLT